MTPFTLAKLSLLRHKFSTVITIIAIGLSVACGGILLRLYQLSESRFETLGYGGEAIIGAKAGGIEILLGSLNGEGKYPDFLPGKLFESLKADQSVKFEDGNASKPSTIKTIIPFVYFAKFLNYRIVGTDDSFYQKFQEKSQTISNGRWFNQNNEVVLGANVANEKNINVGDNISAKAWLGEDTLLNQNIELKVVGVLPRSGTQWDRTLFSSTEEAHSIFNQYIDTLSSKSIWGSNIYHYFLVYLQPSGFNPLEALINRRTVGQIINVEEQKLRLKELTSVGKSVGLFVTAFVILLGGLSVCSMLVARFEGMSLHLAILQAIGYSKKELAYWLMWEGLLLGLMGVAIGAVLDSIGLPILRFYLGSALPSSDLVGSSIISSYMIWIIAILATLISVFIPMIRLSKQDIHSALKGL